MFMGKKPLVKTQRHQGKIYNRQGFFPGKDSWEKASRKDAKETSTVTILASLQNTFAFKSVQSKYNLYPTI
jgi:hypothetical protein